MSSMKVACLGPEGSYTYLVSREVYPDEEIIPLMTIPEVFEYVKRKRAKIGVVPAENSFGGIVYDTVDEIIHSSFKKKQVFIRAEIVKRIVLCLIGRKGEEIKKVYSHPYPLLYMRNWIKKNLSGVKIEETTSTAEAARKCSMVKGTSAIASLESAKIYGLDVLYVDRRKGKRNITSFFVIGKEPVSDGERTAIVYSLENRPGTLYYSLGVFARRRINLTRIISRPHPEKGFGEYIFLVEFEGNERENKIIGALKELERYTTFQKIVGAYRRLEF